MKNLVTTYFLEQKNVSVYIFLYVMLAVLLSCLSVIYFSSVVIFWFVKVIQLLSFIALGILHTATVERGLAFVTDKFESKFYFTILLALMICVALLGFYLFADSTMLIMAIASTCAFFLPYIVVQLWNMYSKTPVSGSAVWYGYNELLDSSDIVYPSSIPITFKLTVGYYDFEAMSFSMKAPLHMELGKVFNLFILAAEKNYDIHIERSDKNNHFYGWQFHAENFMGLLNIQLDPQTDIGNNDKIKADTIIIAKRVEPDTIAYPLENLERT